MVEPQTFKEAKLEQHFIADNSTAIVVGINEYGACHKMKVDDAKTKAKKEKQPHKFHGVTIEQGTPNLKSCLDDSDIIVDSFGKLEFMNII